MGLTNVKQCLCKEVISNDLNIWEVASLIISVILFSFLMYSSLEKATINNERKYIRDLRFKNVDIPLSVGSMMMRGNNEPSNPWEINFVSPETSKLLDEENFFTFRHVVSTFILLGFKERCKIQFPRKVTSLHSECILLQPDLPHRTQNYDEKKSR